MNTRTGARAVLLAVVLSVAATVRAQERDIYVVGLQDVLAVTVIDHGDLSGKFTVEADGRFAFPLIGRVQANGLTPQQIEESVRKRLADEFVRDPQVNVAVVEARSHRVFVTGEVRKQGVFPLAVDTTLIEVLVRAGGITEAASGEVVIVRPKPGQTAASALAAGQGSGSEVIRLDIQELQTGKLMPGLRNNDTIFIPRVAEIYLIGQVKTTGSFALQRGMTVAQLLAKAGGTTGRNGAARLTIIRAVENTATQFPAKLEDVLAPGDTVVVQ